MKNITITEKTNFIEISANTGFYLTTFKADSEKYEEYYGTKLICVPLSADYSDWRTITEEEHNELEVKRDEAIERIMAEEEKERQLH